MFLSRGDRDLGVAFQTHPGRQAFLSSGSEEPRSALESRRVSLGAHWVDSREASLLRRLERGREILRAFLTGIAADRFGNIHPHLAPQVTDNLRKPGPRQFHEKRIHIAADPAAEAVEDLSRGTDREGRGLFLVERTQAFQVLPGSGQRHVLTHDLRDVHPVSDLVDHIVRNQASAHGGPRLYLQGSNHRIAWSECDEYD